MLTAAEILEARSTSAGLPAGEAGGYGVQGYPGHVVMQDLEGNEFCVEPGPAPGPGNGD